MRDTHLVHRIEGKGSNADQLEFLFISRAFAV